ncbi:hypothetical protein BC567DRAFT_221971 [Phyllosticta citribraziliensis]
MVSLIPVGSEIEAWKLSGSSSLKVMVRISPLLAVTRELDAPLPCCSVGRSGTSL